MNPTTTELTWWTTVVIPLFSGLIGAAIGAWATWRVQTRKQVRRDRSVAHALLQDLDRLEASLAPDVFTDGAFRYFDRVFAQVHPWVEPLIVELAGSDPAIVGSFMRLNPALAKYQAAFNSALTEKNRVSQYEEELRRQREAAGADTERLRGVAATEAYLLEVADSFEDGLAHYAEQSTNLESLFQELRSRLLPIAYAPEPKFFPIPGAKVGILNNDRARQIS